MTRRFGIVTDSNSQITPQLAERFGVEVVPMTVTIDDVDFIEGVDLDADQFYAHFTDGCTPDVATSQPAPGRFVETYSRLVERGCEEIWSIHLSSAMSGTVAAAKLAALETPVPVHVVDTTTASFGVAVCVWTAGAAIERGADRTEITTAIREQTDRLGTAFMAGVPLLTERGGRATDVDVDLGDDGIQILAMSRGELRVLGRVDTVDDTVGMMTDYASSWTSDHPAGVTVAVGVADEASRHLADRLTTHLRALHGVDEVVHYRVGPSVGAHTGPGTFGLFVFPTIG
jgi:DegV family protein with EDD domain